MLLNYRDVGEEEGLKLGLTLPRYVGTAVTRNRLKRWVREFFRQNEIGLSHGKGLHANVVFRRKEKGFYKNLSHEEFKKVIRETIFKFEKKRC